MPTPHSLQSLSDPLPGDQPAGQGCEREIGTQNFALMTEYLVERAIQKGRERGADQAGLSEKEASNAASVRDDGKRRLTSLEGILKDVLRLSTVNVEQVGKVLLEKTSTLLAERGKDLRLLPHLAGASTLSDGLTGYLAALKLADALLMAFPAELFPLPDEDNPADVWERANAVSELLSGEGIRALLGQVVLIDARQAGRLTLADLVGGLRGDIPVDEVSAIELDMALNEIGAADAQQLLASLREVVATIDALARRFDGGALPTRRLAEPFKRAVARVALFAEGGASAESSVQSLASAAAAPVASAGARNELRSREDARRAIQDVIRLLEKLEPSHPAPPLLKRADRLLGMGFLDIIKDMAPDALSDIERIVRTEPSE